MSEKQVTNVMVRLPETVAKKVQKHPDFSKSKGGRAGSGFAGFLFETLLQRLGMEVEIPKKKEKSKAEKVKKAPPKKEASKKKVAKKKVKKSAKPVVKERPKKAQTSIKKVSKLNLKRWDELRERILESDERDFERSDWMRILAEAEDRKDEEVEAVASEYFGI